MTAVGQIGMKKNQICQVWTAEIYEEFGIGFGGKIARNSEEYRFSNGEKE